MSSLKAFAAVFISVFLAEIGDKTQIATLLFASDKQIGKWVVFAGAATALVTTSLIAVIAGEVLSHYINPRYLHYAAGAGFILIGIYMLATG